MEPGKKKIRPLSEATDMAKLQELLKKAKSGESRTIDEKEMRGSLNNRVKGQDHVIDDLVKFTRQQWAKKKRSRPIASVLFLGPTGTGKTELAKAMADYLYGDDKAMVQFDCASDLATKESKSTLIGSPVGYIGSGPPGRLTGPVLAQPKRLILFDEVEKGDPAVFDIFLSVMGDGRLADANTQNGVADFTQSIIVLTSNLEAAAIGAIQEQVEDPEERVAAVKSHLVGTGKFRPEIMGRIDKIYVFKPLSEDVMLQIIWQKMCKLAGEYGLELVGVAPELVVKALQAGQKLKKFGVRELDRHIGNMFADKLLDAQEHDMKEIKLWQDSQGRVRIRDAADDAAETESESEQAGEEEAADSSG